MLNKNNYFFQERTRSPYFIDWLDISYEDLEELRHQHPLIKLISYLCITLLIIPEITIQAFITVLTQRKEVK